MTLQRRTDMNYDNIDKDTTIVFQNGMRNTYENALEAQQLIQEKYPNDKVGLINNETGTFSYASDFVEWFSDTLTTKDVLNAYIYKQMSPDTLLMTHSAGNEDSYKTNKVNELLGVSTPYKQESYGSPRSATSLEVSNTMVGATLESQTNHSNDPIANGWVNEDANYEVDYSINDLNNKNILDKIPIFEDLNENHPFVNYLNDEKVNDNE